MSISTVVELWNEFFWSARDLRPLMLFKVFFGSFVFLENFISIYKRVHLYSADGFFPASQYALHIGRRRPSLFLFGGGSSNVVRLVFLIGALAGLSLAFGWLEPVAALVIFLVQVSKRNRNHRSVYSGESVAKMFALLLIFAPSESFANWGSPCAFQLMKVQLCIIWARSTYYKLRVPGWLSGEMAFKVLATSHASIAPRVIAKILSINAVSKVSSWSVLAIQSSAPVLLWFKETSLPMILLCASMHLGMQMFMSIGFFQAYMITGLLLFLPEQAADHIFALLGLG